MNQQKLTFYDHILEIRKRLFMVFVVFVLGSILGFVFNSEIQAILINPLGQQLYYTSPMGGFSFMFNISLFAGALIAIPFCVLHIIKFVAPTIGHNKSAFALKLLIASLLLTIAGVSFAYNVSLPPTLNFLTGFDSDIISSLISTSEYLGFIKLYLAAFALIFQIPLILLIINTIKPIDPQKMLKTQKYVVVSSFIAAAIISPTPDALNQTLMAAPMILLYELSIGLIWFINKRKQRKESINQAKASETPYDYLASIDDFAEESFTPNRNKVALSSPAGWGGIAQNDTQPLRRSVSGILSEEAHARKVDHAIQEKPVNQDPQQHKKHIDIKQPKNNYAHASTKAADNRHQGRVQRRYYAKRNESYNTRQRYSDRSTNRPLLDDFTPRQTVTAS